MRTTSDLFEDLRIKLDDFIRQLEITVQNTVEEEKQRVEQEMSEKMKEIDEKQKKLDELEKKYNNTIVGNRVKLDIGGTLFSTTISTLTSQKNSFFSAMFSKDFGVKPEADGSYFIDREANDFSLILSRLRGEEVDKKMKSLSNERRERLFEDINYYCLQDTFSDYINPTCVQCVATLNSYDKIGLIIELNNDEIASCAGFADFTRDRTIKIWNTREGKCIATLISHTHNIYSLTKLRNRRFASGSLDKTIKIW
ncbi:hypothetical protein AKO1_006923, partial [Acrasis kona]